MTFDDDQRRLPSAAEHLIERLRKQGTLTDLAVAQALRAVPRHCFVPDEGEVAAYRDEAIPVLIDGDHVLSSSSQPSAMVTMLEMLRLEPGMRVLEVGTGTGFNAALVGHMVGPQGRVVSVEIEPSLVRLAQKRITALGMEHVEVVAGDGTDGWADGAPYDCIIVTAGAAEIARSWFDQLAPRGRLLVSLSFRTVQQTILFERDDDVLRSCGSAPIGFMRMRGSRAGPAHKRFLPGSRAYLRTEHQIPGLADLAEALDGPAKIIPTGVTATREEVHGPLSFTLALCDKSLGQLGIAAEPEVVRRSTVPELVEWRNGPFLDRMTLALVEERSIAMLARRQGPGGMWDLDVRCHGNDAALGVRLVGHIRSWHLRGRPASNNYEIVVLLSPADVTSTDRPWVIKTGSTAMVVRPT